MIWLDQIAACAPHVAPATMARLIEVESGGDRFSVHVNGVPEAQQPHPATLADAVAAARAALAAGHSSVDLGLTQLNSANLPGLGLTLTAAFDPCRNIAAGAAILTADYAAATARYGAGTPALLAALSAYNTGTLTRGFGNGYVARYLPGGTVPVAPAALPPPDPYSADTEIAWHAP